MGKGLILSFALHVIVIAVAIIFLNGNVKKQQETITVFLTDSELPGEENKAGRPGPARPGVKLASPPAGNQSPVSRKGRTEPVPAAIPRTMAPAPPRAEGGNEAPKMTMAAVGESHDASQTSSPFQPAGLASAPSLGGGGIAEGGGFGAGTAGAGTGIGGGSGPGHGIGSGVGDGAGGLEKQYLERHFAYIRDLILKNMKYPPLARRMGWKGTVTVSFVVLENGAAENIRITKSSGREVLDQTVMKTIQGVQPFPHPPVRAELIIPIAFRLE
jgi:protein TonB